MTNPFKGKYGPLLIAEIGGNHEGDFEYAKHLVRLAIETDVDFVKFQILTGDTLVSEVESPDRNRHFKNFQLTKDQHLELARMVTDAGLHYTSSVWDVTAMKWIDDFIPVYKIGSGDLTAYPVLRETAQIGKPMIISTGLATEQEVLDTVSFVQSVNPIYKQKDMLALLQCTSMYPINPSDANLNVMHRLREQTGLSIGYSDHTEGSKALKYAVAMGAEVVEFHFTDQRQGKSFRDHQVSLVPSEVRELINEIQLIHTYKGDGEKKPMQIERENGHDVSFRRGVYPSRDIKAGEELTPENITVLRPNHGIDAREYDNVIGKKATGQLQKHQKLNWQLFE